MHRHYRPATKPAMPDFVTPPTGDYQSSDPPPRLAREKTGDRIGAYKLLQKLGEGGMGAVWHAEQTAPVRRQVALKLIRPDLAADHFLARFEAERQALALMDHPNIAKVFDAGTTESGAPYLVMELVKGIPFTKYCDDAKLTIRERVQLFVPVCRAVQHAHTKGIIHRDLKPSNILVALYDGVPVPKIIDFGIAKATHQPLTERTLVTQLGSVVGTPEYMAPEQAEFNALDIDTRADVYSLGVILYETLSGSPPFSRKEIEGRALLELLRFIKETEPPSPSKKLSSVHTLPEIAAKRRVEPQKLRKIVAGELDWVVMKALEKERGRRYTTADLFAADLEHYLADEPVAAGPPSQWYRFRKFARRRKVSLIFTSIAVPVLIGSAATVLHNREKRLEAESRASFADEVAESAKAATRWEEHRNKIGQIRSWLTDSDLWFPLSGRNARIPLSLRERDRLYRAMMSDVLASVDREKPLPFDSKLTWALQTERFVRNMAACEYDAVDLDQPEKAIDHIKRSLSINKYLGSADSGSSIPGVFHGFFIRDLVWLNHLRERSGAEVTDSDVSDLLAAINPAQAPSGDKMLSPGTSSVEVGFTRFALGTSRHHIRCAPSAMRAIRGASLALCGEYAKAEPLLIDREKSFREYHSKPELQSQVLAEECFPGEYRSMLRRLVTLYTRWERADAVRKWQHEIDLHDARRTMKSVWALVSHADCSANAAAEALAIVDRIVQLMPDDPVVIRSMAAAQYRLSRFSDSLKTIQRLVTTDKTEQETSAEDLLLAALAQFKLGESDASRISLDRARGATKKVSDEEPHLLREAEKLIEGSPAQQ